MQSAHACACFAKGRYWFWTTFVDFDPLWTTLFRSQNRPSEKATKKPQKRRLKMCFFGFGRFLPQFRGGALGGKFALFPLFFTTPAPKAAQRVSGAPPASKWLQNEPKWTPKCSKMLSCWTPFGFIFRNVVSSCVAQRKAQVKIGERSVLFSLKKVEPECWKIQIVNIWKIENLQCWLVDFWTCKILLLFVYDFWSSKLKWLHVGYYWFWCFLCDIARTRMLTL